MLIIFILVAVFVAGVLLLKYGNWDFSSFGVPLVGISGLGLLLCAISIPVERIGSRAEIAAIQELQRTASVARASDDGIEGAAYRIKVAEANQWIARKQFYRTTVFAIWIPAEVEQLQPIQ